MNRAAVLFDYLHGHLTALGRDYAPVVSDTDSFRRGMVQAVSEALDERRGDRGEMSTSPAGKGLVLSEDDDVAREVDEYLEERFGRLGKKDGRAWFDPNSLGLGKAVGRKISLAEQLGG